MVWTGGVMLYHKFFCQGSDCGTHEIFTFFSCKTPGTPKPCDDVIEDNRAVVWVLHSSVGAVYAHRVK